MINHSNLKYIYLSMILIFIIVNLITAIFTSTFVTRYHAVQVENILSAVSKKYSPENAPHGMDAFNWIRVGDSKILHDFKVAFLLRECSSFSEDQVKELYLKYSPITKSGVRLVSPIEEWMLKLSSNIPCPSVTNFLSHLDVWQVESDHDHSQWDHTHENANHH